MMIIIVMMMILCSLISYDSGLAVDRLTDNQYIIRFGYDDDDDYDYIDLICFQTAIIVRKMKYIQSTIYCYLQLMR